MNLLLDSSGCAFFCQFLSSGEELLGLVMSVGQSVGRSVGLSVGRSVCRSVGRSVGPSKKMSKKILQLENDLSEQILENESYSGS